MLMTFTQKSGNVVVNFISVGRVVKLQVDIGAEIILGAENLETLKATRAQGDTASTHMQAAEEITNVASD